MTKEELYILQNYPLDIKVAKTKARIREWVRYWGEGNVAISFSGGKDSTVLLHIARQEYPNLKAVFCDTGLEYPEIKEFVRQTDNVDIVRPRKSFKQVITDYGYPIVSKEQAACIDEIRNTKSEKLRNRRLYGDKLGRFKLSEKWQYLLDAPFKISSRCCYHLKKGPLYSYENKNNIKTILGTLAEESSLRRSAYLRFGCNAFDAAHPTSKPLSFWKQQDILEYIKQNDLKIAPVYGDVVEVSSQIGFFPDQEKELKCTGVNRTGCIFCGFGCQSDPKPNRFQMLKETHPNLYNYCINGGEYDENGLWGPNKDGLGFSKVLDYLNVEY